MKKIIIFVLASVMAISLASCDSGKTKDRDNQFGGISFGEFGNVGNDPNNIHQDGHMAFDDNYIYFSLSSQGFDGIYRVDYSGGNFERIADGLVESLNIYKNKLYYVSYMNDIEVLDLDTMQSEDFKSSSGPGISEIKRSGHSYGSYGKINQIFIANGYLFYTNTSGFSGTSEGQSTTAYAVKLDSDSEPMRIADSGGKFATDGENIYIIGKCKIAFEDLENWRGDAAKKQNYVNSSNKYDRAFVIGLNGICCISGRGEKYISYTYKSLEATEDSDWTEPVTFFDLNSVEDNDTLLSSARFIVGSSMVCIGGGSIVFYKNCNFNKKEVLGSYGYNPVMGRNDGSVYVISTGDYNEISLCRVDSDGAFTSVNLNKPGEVAQSE